MGRRKRAPTRAQVLLMLQAVVNGNPNDCARLALEDNPPIDQLDLSMLQEVRRAANGAVEVRLVDRLRAAELLLKLLEEESDGAEAFFAGLTQAARQTSTPGKA